MLRADKIRIRSPREQKRLMVAKLYLSKEFEKALEESEKLLDLRDDLISQMHLAAALHLTPKEEKEGWNKIRKLYSEEDSIPINVITQAGLIYAQRKDYEKSRSMIEKWIMSQAVAEKLTPDFKTKYLQLIDVYLNSMAALGEFQTCSYFLDLCSVLDKSEILKFNKKLNDIKNKVLPLINNRPIMRILNQMSLKKLNIANKKD